MERDRPPVIRPFTTGDIPFAMILVEGEGWCSSVEVMQLHLQHAPAGCFIAEASGERLGMVTTISFRDSAWIGNLIVAPGARARGLGTRLMEHAVHHLEEGGQRTLRLEADPMGLNIYRRLGFSDEYDSPRFALGGCR